LLKAEVLAVAVTAGKLKKDKDARCSFFFFHFDNYTQTQNTQFFSKYYLNNDHRQFDNAPYDLSSSAWT